MQSETLDGLIYQGSKMIAVGDIKHTDAGAPAEDVLGGAGEGRADSGVAESDNLLWG